MNKKKKLFKVIISLLIAFSLFFIGIFITYNNYFAPKVNVTSIDSTINVNPLELAIKLIPKDSSFSFKEIKTNSTIDLTEKDLTNLSILVIQQNPKLSQFLTGLQFCVNNDKLTLYVEFKYFNIPLEAKLNFNCYSENGKAILHYDSGNLGFISISSSTIFNYLASNEFITVNSKENNIELNFPNSKNLTVTEFNIVNNKLEINLEAILKLF